MATIPLHLPINTPPLSPRNIHHRNTKQKKKKKRKLEFLRVSKMNVLDALHSTPIDALVLNHVDLGLLSAVNNLWTWVALVTAAVTFWRLRSHSPSTPPPPLSPSPSVQSPPRDTLLAASSSDSASTQTQTDELRNVVVKSPISHSCCDYDGVTKWKFRVTYYEDEEDEEDTTKGECIDDGQVTEGAAEEEEWWSSWENVLRMKTGEVVWYRCQDLTAINGNVVRLWDDVKRSSSCNINGVVDCNYASPRVLVW